MSEYRRAYLVRVLLLLASLGVLIACGPDPYQPQILPTPGAEQDRISLRLDQLTVKPTQANVVMLVHIFTENRIPWGLRYPKDSYILMEGGTRRGTTDIYDRVATVPLSAAESTAVVVTIVSVPDSTSQFAIQTAVDGIAEAAKGYAGTVVKVPWGSYIAGKLIDAVVQQVEQEISNGQVLAIYRFKMTRDGSLVSEAASDYDSATLTAQTEVSKVIATSVPVTTISPERATPTLSPLLLFITHRYRVSDPDDHFVAVRARTTKESQEVGRLTPGTEIVCEGVVDGQLLEYNGQWSNQWANCSEQGGYIFLPLLIPLP